MRGIETPNEGRVSFARRIVWTDGRCVRLLNAHAQDSFVVKETDELHSKYTAMKKSWGRVSKEGLPQPLFAPKFPGTSGAPTSWAALTDWVVEQHNAGKVPGLIACGSKEAWLKAPMSVAPSLPMMRAANHAKLMLDSEILNVLSDLQLEANEEADQAEAVDEADKADEAVAAVEDVEAVEAEAEVVVEGGGGSAGGVGLHAEEGMEGIDAPGDAVAAQQAAHGGTDEGADDLGTDEEEDGGHERRG